MGTAIKEMSNFRRRFLGAHSKRTGPTTGPCAQGKPRRQWEGERRAGWTHTAGGFQGRENPLCDAVTL